MALEAAQVEYDLGCEDIIARHGVGANGRPEARRVGPAQLSRPVVLPPLHREPQRARPSQLLEAFLQAGGTVLCCGEPPARVDGSASDRGAALAQAAAAGRRSSRSRLPALLPRAEPDDGFAIQRAAGRPGHPVPSPPPAGRRRAAVPGQHQHRIALRRHDRVRRCKGVEQWNLYTGEAEPYPFDGQRHGRPSRLRPAALAAACCCSSPKQAAAARRRHADGDRHAWPPPARSEIRRLEPNVLTLDYVDVTAGGETRTQPLLLPGQPVRLAEERHGPQPVGQRRAVQGRADHEEVPGRQRLQASYRFTIEGAVPDEPGDRHRAARPLHHHLQRPAGRRPKPGDWWLDKAFGRIDHRRRWRSVGENVVTLKAAPFTMYHELEPAYVLGDFTLKPAAKGFVIAPGPAARSSGTAGTSKGIRSTAAAWPIGSSSTWPSRRAAIVVVAARAGTAAWPRCCVNGKPAGYIAAPPWECDVTKQLKPGENTIEVIVIGTLKNTLGPHHGKPALGSAWPRHVPERPQGRPAAGRRVPHRRLRPVRAVCLKTHGAGPPPGQTGKQSAGDEGRGASVEVGRKRRRLLMTGDKFSMTVPRSLC